MQYLYLIFSLLFLASCGAEDLLTDNLYFADGNPVMDDQIDSEFIEYVNQFRNEGIKRGVDIVYLPVEVSKSDLSDRSSPGRTVLGVCWTNTKQVFIDTVEWEMRKDLRPQLIFHELGHCLLGRGHNDSTPSIMRSFIVSKYQFEKDMDILLDELFDKEKINDSRKVGNL